jgi:DNA-binding transcriptional ArsR family regulator
MNITPSEAEEALTAIQSMMEKTRRAISSSGAYKFLILWGVIWMLGFMGSQFFSTDVAQKLWIGLDILGGLLSAVIGMRMNRGVRSSDPTTTGKQIGFFGCYSSSIVHRNCCRLACGWQAVRHVHHPVRDRRLDCHGFVAQLCLSLVGLGIAGIIFGGLFPPAGYFLSLDGSPGWRRDDSFGRLCQEQVVSMPGLNETIHQTVRLRIMAALVILNPGDEVEFTYLRDLLDVTDGNLGAHLRKLEEAGYITVNKTFVERTTLLHLCHCRRAWVSRNMSLLWRQF